MKINNKFDLEDNVVVTHGMKMSKSGIIFEIRSKLYKSISGGFYKEINTHEYGVKYEDGGFEIVQEEFITNGDSCG